MANLLNTGAAWLNEQLASHVATSITYSRPGQPDVSITATVGQSEYESDPTFGQMEFTSRDYTFPIAALGSLGEPARGDQITEGNDVFDVSAPDENMQVFRYCDHGKTRVRVHTKRTVQG